MNNITEKIAQAGPSEIGVLLEAVLKRYGELFPDWEINTFTFQKQQDRNRQIEDAIRLLEAMKTET